MHQLDQTSKVPVNHKAVLVATAAAFAVGAPAWMRAATTPWEVLGELARSGLVAYVTARLVVRARVADWKGALALGAGVCVFQSFILLGSVIHEHLPLEGFAVQGCYALVSTLVAAAIIMVARRSESASREPPAPASAAYVNYKAVILAAAAAVMVGAVWYSPLLFGEAWSQLKASTSVGGPKISPAEVMGELVRSGFVAYVLARFVVAVRVSGWKGSMMLGFVMWLGFHATLLLYSVIHQHMAPALWAIHAGHGLVNDLVIAVIVGAFRRAAKPDRVAKSLVTRAANSVPTLQKTARP